MARAVTSDPLLSNKYVVSFVDSGFVSHAGFSQVSLPEMSIETAEYREGLNSFSKKFPLRATFSTVTLSRGITLQESGFYNWIMKCIDGRGYRNNILIKQFHRNDVQGLFDYTNAKPSRVIECFYCFPIRFRPSGDLDAHASEVAIAVSYTHLTLPTKRIV